MKIYKENPINFEKVNITRYYYLSQALVSLLFCVICVLSIYILNKPVNTVHHTTIQIDTFKQLVVLKHGLSEITVDRNANIPIFCNNPGALRPSSIKEVNELAIGTIQCNSGNFLYFANKEHGYKALEIVLRKVYWNSTIQQCINKYAPNFENNTDSYVGKIIDKLGCKTTSKVKDCNIKKLMQAIAEIEGFIK